MPVLNKEESSASTLQFETELQNWVQKDNSNLLGGICAVLALCVFGIAGTSDSGFSAIYNICAAIATFFETNFSVKINYSFLFESVLTVFGLISFFTGLGMGRALFKVNQYSKIIKVLEIGFKNPATQKSAISNFMAFTAADLVPALEGTSTIRLVTKKNMSIGSYSILLDEDGWGAGDLIILAGLAALLTFIPISCIFFATTSTYPFTKFSFVVLSFSACFWTFYFQYHKFLASKIQLENDIAKELTSQISTNENSTLDVSLPTPILKVAAPTTLITKTYAFFYKKLEGFPILFAVMCSCTVFGTVNLLCTANTYGVSKPFNIVSEDIKTFNTKLAEISPDSLWIKNEKIRVPLKYSDTEIILLTWIGSSYEKPANLFKARQAECSEYHQFKLVVVKGTGTNREVCIHPTLAEDATTLVALETSYKLFGAKKESK